ncbi:MAG: hypothetical protein M0R46_14595 [Candidatus Muirbacterium halophilum]|nr:hypothetical protein [Candidatus Muirbacterium halophilum]MCK9477150.1 hypothetical protein [Candidatus Muirbacterium halophilum]
MFLITNNPGIKSSDIPGFLIISEKSIEFYYYPYPLYFAFKNGFYYISDNINKIRENILSKPSFDGVLQLLLFNCNFYPYSIFENIIPIHPYTRIYDYSKKPIFKKIQKQNEKISKEEFFVELDNILLENTYNDYSKYLLFSGGLDSSLIKHYIKKNILFGTTLYDDITKNECYEILNLHDNVIFLKNDKNAFFEVFKNTVFVFPFINAGYIDDRMHVLNAFKNNTQLIYTGTGADELLGDYNFVNFNNIKLNPEWFSKNVCYSLFADLKSYLPFEKVSEIFCNSIQWFDFENKKNKIDFIVNSFLIPNQNALMSNNVYDIEYIERVNPFVSQRFFDLCNGISEYLCENNFIEKYVLKEFAKTKGFYSLSMRSSRDFDYRGDLNYSESFEKYIIDNVNLFELFDNYKFLSNLNSFSKDTKIKLSIFLKILKDFSLGNK